MFKIKNTFLLISIFIFIFSSQVFSASDMKSYQLDSTTEIVAFYNKTGYKITADMLINATQEDIEKYLPEGKTFIDVNVFLLKTKDLNILIDTGFGEKADNNLITSLAKLNIRPEDINAVLLTHMHPDHIDGLITNNKATFPKANIWVSKPEFLYWTSEKNKSNAPGFLKSNFSRVKRISDLYKNKIKIFSTQDKIIANITPILTYGHTPGHVGYLFETAQGNILFAGDIISVKEIQLPLPEVATVADNDYLKSIMARKDIFAEAAKNNWLVAFTHVPFPGVGYVKSADIGFEFIEK